MKLSKLFSNFFHSEKTGGFILIFCAIISILITNGKFGHSYMQFWETKLGVHTIAEWINDGLMTIFFLLVGLELEREVYKGELSTFKNALLPALAALGGVLIPASIYWIFNQGTLTLSGTGIPMATDIAFAIGMLSLLGNAVPNSLKIFLTALAVIDDLLAILVIAFFYTSTFHFSYLIIALLIFGVLLILNRLKVHHIFPYIIGGIGMWYCMEHSGVHATLSGVLLAFAIPFGDGSEKTISYKLQHFLHKPVAFIIIPLFALANTCILFSNGWQNGILSREGWGIIVGLVAGKPIGILIFSFIAVSTRLCQLPEDLKWKHLMGAGMLAGIGFTMSIFISLLAFDNPAFILTAKISILIASVCASIFGLIFLRWTAKSKR